MQSVVLKASSLVGAMALVTPFATRKDDKHPDAACVFVEARDGKIVLLCANMESFARIELPCETKHSFKGFVDAERLGAIGVDCPGDLMLSADGENLIITHADKSAKSAFKLYITKGNSFHKVPAIDQMDTLFTAPCVDLIEAFRLTELALPAKDHQGRTPNAILIVASKNNEINLAATDSTRLMLFEGLEVECKKFPAVLVKPDVIYALRKFVETLAPGKVSLSHKGNTICFVGGAFAVGGNVVAGEFPNIKKFIDVERTGAAIVSPPVLKRMLKQAVRGKDNNGADRPITILAKNGRLTIKRDDDMDVDMPAETTGELQTQIRAQQSLRLPAIHAAQAHKWGSQEAQANRSAWSAPNAPEAQLIVAPAA